MKYWFVFGFIVLSKVVLAQSAEDYIRQGIAEMEAGQYAAALDLLQKAEKMAPENMAPVYEMGMVYYLQKKYKQAVPFFQKIIQGPQYKNTDALAWAMLGNAQSLSGDSAAAVNTYQEGRKKFPQSGRLFMEEGHLYTQHGDYSKALCCYETAVKTEPVFPGGSRGAATIWAITDERFHALHFGELFMNLETGGERNENMSELLYKIINEAVTLTDTTAEVTLTKNMLATVEKGKPVLPLAASYESCFMMGISSILIQRGNNKTRGPLHLQEIVSLYRVANAQWFDRGLHKKYPDELLDRQQKLLDKTLLEPYVYWLFRKGRPAEYKEWLSKNKELFEQFKTWMEKNLYAPTSKKVYQSGFACKN